MNAASSSDEFPDVSVVITFRAAHPSRVAALMRVLAHYAALPGVEIIVVEQDGAPALLPAFPPMAKRLFVHNPGVFNKSWGSNVGAVQSERGLLLFADADLLVAPNALIRALRLCRGRVAAANPFDRIVDFNDADSTALIAGAAAPDWKRSDGRDRRRDNEALNFCGGAFAIRRDVFLSVGGFDERFLGWGGEDDAMAIKLTRAGIALGQVQDSVALHLWHPQDRAATFDQPHYAGNVALAKALTTLDETTFRFQCEVQRQLLGHPRKYELAALPVRMDADARA